MDAFNDLAEQFLFVIEGEAAKSGSYVLAEQREVFENLFGFSPFRPFRFKPFPLLNPTRCFFFDSGTTLGEFAGIDETALIAIEESLNLAFGVADPHLQPLQFCLYEVRRM